jgi:hypothetical protein
MPDGRDQKICVVVVQAVHEALARASTSHLCMRRHGRMKLPKGLSRSSALRPPPWGR